KSSTLFNSLQNSRVPAVIFSAPMRRMVRPRGRMAFHLQKQLPSGEKLRLESIVTKINSGEIVPSPPKTIPPGLPSVDKLAKQLEPANVPSFIKNLLRRYPWICYIPLALAVLVLLLLFIFGITGVLLAAGVVIAAVLIYLWWMMAKWLKEIK